MDRRTFLKDAGIVGAAMSFGLGPTRLLSADSKSNGGKNVNWVDPKLKATLKVSSYVTDPPWGYLPSNIFGDNPYMGWESFQQTRGAWLEVDFPESRSISELWVRTQPLARDIVGQAPYMLTYSRAKLRTNPRKVRFSFSGGEDIESNLSQATYFQIVSLPKHQETASIRILIEDVWNKPGAVETGLGKFRAFPHPHMPSFEIDAWPTYDVHKGKAVQAATLHIVNPGAAIAGAQLSISEKDGAETEVLLADIPAHSMSEQDTWIPAPFEDTVMTFTVKAAGASFGAVRSLHVPAYHTYFSHGSFSFDCTCHNDLGWLNTQEKTADYRSAEIILPAMKLLKEYPEFRYSMECTAYLMEFLERHPEKRQEMTALMKEKRFEFGASFVECQDVSVGPEKLARQFYFGRRWLMKTFPGVDTRFYVQTDPPEMTLQLPQLLKRAGVEYYIQGRMPYGYYRWEAPDGSSVMTYAYHYADPMRLLNPEGNQGWLRYAQGREYYYEPHHLPPQFLYDYTSDYLPPQPALPPYVREQNAAMKRFAGYWKAHHRQIDPPILNFATLEGFLDDFTKHPLDITTLKGDWPFSWAYYDEPSNREALANGREAHNRLLIAERLFSGLSLESGFKSYPTSKFTEGWRANCWPDHGWGGNRGIITDAVYAASYAKSKKLADEVLQDAGSQLVRRTQSQSAAPISLVVFNPLNWERTDVVQAELSLPSDWRSATVRDSRGHSLPCELSRQPGGKTRITFVAEAIPSLGYCTYSVEPSTASTEPISGRSTENDFLKVTFGDGGIRSLYDKRLKWEIFRTEKFDGGEVLQFTAPGNAWEDTENVTMENFDQTCRHPFPFKTFTKGPVRTTALREATFDHFVLREHFHLYHALDRMEIELEVVNWDGQKSRELRAAFPINLDAARLSYEAPFGKVEMGKDELNFTLLPKDPHTAFRPDLYGGDHPLAYREAINWIDASSRNYLANGCLSPSDSTVHLFRDETTHPVSYPVLQHVLLSTRKSLAWNPPYWFNQKGSYRYRMAILPHQGDWRLRYREGIGFNYPLTAFASSEEGTSGVESPAVSLFQLKPENLCLTALKKSEDDDGIVMRFYEAEGFKTPASIRCSKPIRRAWRTSLIEENESPIQPASDGSLQFDVGPWEIVTLKMAF